MQLVIASEQEKQARDPLAWAEWGARLTVEQFLERERQLRAHPWSRQGMQTWLWRSDSGEVLSSCETFRMRSYLGPGPMDRREEGVTFGVASVLTEPRLRGRGHATAMMRALVDRLCAEPHAQASLLYSDVGAPLYERAGYVPRPALDRVFTAERGDPAGAVDTMFTERELESALSAMPVPDDEFVIWPEAVQLDWHLERERVYASLLSSARPRYCGARAGGSTAFWATDLKNRVLRILLLAASRSDETLAVLQAARRSCAQCGLEEVRLCEQPVSFEWPRTDSGGVISDRIGELPMLASLDPRVRPEQWNLAPRALWV